MKNPLTTIVWMEKSERLNKLIGFSEEKLHIYPMDSGFEAEVVKICADNECFVLKSWNKYSKPDIQFQYRLLEVLSNYVPFVSKPVSWGIDNKQNQVLLTPYDGYPLRKNDYKMLGEIAIILSHIHQLPITEMEDLNIPKYDFIDYFYPGIHEYPDLQQLLTHLVSIANIKQDRFIHGDFHMENIVEDHGQLMVIDWTNGQIGDARYDFIWSFTLSQIYNPVSEFPPIFASTYLLKLPMNKDEINVFEALAYLRWLLLYRKGHVPVIQNTLEKVKDLISRNLFLIGKGLL